MNRTSAALLVLLGFLFGVSHRSSAQAAVEAGAISASVSGIATTSSRVLNRHPLPSRTIFPPATAVHAARPAHSTQTNASRKQTIATAANRTSGKQGHVVSVWPKDALTREEEK